MKIGDLELKGRLATTPDWLARMRAADDIAKHAGETLDTAERARLLQQAVDEMRGAAIDAASNGSRWYRQALQDHFKFRGRNRGRGGVTTEQKVEFLSEFVLEHDDPNRPLNPEAVALMLSNEWAEMARTYWPESHFPDLENAVRNFAKRTEIRSQVFPKRS